MIRNVKTMICAAALFASLSTAAFATPFTYQGRLTDSGMDANGTYDLLFKLMTAASGGSQVGSTQTINDINVIDGLFTTTLDFGANAFDGSNRWIEISVRPGASSGVYVILNPRQPVTAAPMAMHALNTLWTASGTAIKNANTGFVGINRTTAVSPAEVFGLQSATVIGYGGMYIRTEGTGGKPFYGYVAGNSGGATSWTELDGATGNWKLHHNTDDVMVVTPNGDVGIGDTTPDARLDVHTTSGNAIEAYSNGAFSYGVHGTGASAGIYGVCGSSNGAGVKGVNNTPGGAGVEGSTSATGASGVTGYGNFGTGVYGQTSSGYGVYGSNGGSSVTGHAGYFNGRVHVAGILSKSGGSFKIDHPLDPKNKTLSHSFVESPDMMNIYNGNVVLDADGRAVVAMPDWFQALNFEFRYQLTAIGAPGPNLYVAEEISDNKFVIAGGVAGTKVSWQVTGVRQDAWAAANRIPVEQVKSAAERGLYLNPEAFGADATMSITNAIEAVHSNRADDAAAE